MKKTLWEPSVERIRNANMTRFMEYVGKKRNIRFSGYFDLYQWSVDRIPEFWEDVWDFVGIKASKKYDKVVRGPYCVPRDRLVPRSRAELRGKPPEIPGRENSHHVQGRDETVRFHNTRRTSLAR